MMMMMMMMMMIMVVVVVVVVVVLVVMMMTMMMMIRQTEVPNYYFTLIAKCRFPCWYEIKRSSDLHYRRSSQVQNYLNRSVRARVRVRSQPANRSGQGSIRVSQHGGALTVNKNCHHDDVATTISQK